MLVDEGLGVELAAAEHEPDRLDRLVADGRQPMRDGRIDRDGVAGLEDVLVEADPDLEAAAQDVAPFVTGVPLERVGRTRGAADLVGHVEELDAGLRHRRQAFPQDARREPDRVPVAARWTGGAAVIVPADGRAVGRVGSRGLGWSAVVEQQLVERDVELVGDRVERADRRVGAPGLDLRDQAGRDAEPLGQLRRLRRRARRAARRRSPISG